MEEAAKEKAERPIERKVFNGKVIVEVADGMVLPPKVEGTLPLTFDMVRRLFDVSLSQVKVE